MPIDEGHINYFVHRGLGPHLILVPGSFNDRRAFSDMVLRLDPEINITIIELRGHGGSWPPPKNGSIEQFAGDVIAVANRIHSEVFFIGGHSIGGMIALEVGRIGPERVRGIISIEGWTKAQAQKEAFGDTGQDTITNTLAEKRKKIRESVMKNWTKQQVEHFGGIWRHWDGTQFLKSTSLPILEIWGDRGREKPSINQLYIPRRDNIEVRWIQNTSHTIPIEAPNKVAEAINDFVRRVSATTPRINAGPARRE